MLGYLTTATLRIREKKCQLLLPSSVHNIVFPFPILKKKIRGMLMVKYSSVLSAGTFAPLHMFLVVLQHILFLLLLVLLRRNILDQTNICFLNFLVSVIDVTLHSLLKFSCNSIYKQFFFSNRLTTHLPFLLHLFPMTRDNI